MARLHRMETDQNNKLDAALLILHADLSERFAAQDRATADLYSKVENILRQALARMPPGQAGQGELILYLRTLINWVNIDIWPNDSRFSGPALSPNIIERSLNVKILSVDNEPQDQCGRTIDNSRRIVILGAPGSGKTGWLNVPSAVAQRKLFRASQKVHHWTTLNCRFIQRAHIFLVKPETSEKRAYQAPWSTLET